jgi:SAM-dependent methyltransferase
VSADDTDLDLLRDHAYATRDKLDDRRALYELQDPRPDFSGWILDRVPWPTTGRVVDVGCGPGTHLARLTERCPHLATVAADLSPGMLEAARQEAPGCAPVAVDACRLPFADATFDVAMANHMLYHVADLDLAVAELRRVVERGGHLVAVTNADDHIGELYRALARAAGRPDWARPSRRFTVENGGRVLGRHFAEVDLHHRVGRIALPVAEPAVTFARSMRDLSGGGFTDDEWAELIDRFERDARDRIARDGVWRLTTHTGAFVCS